jgi:5-methylcytosine-specific restriction endonuclease McrA
MLVGRAVRRNVPRSGQLARRDSGSVKRIDLDHERQLDDGGLPFDPNNVILLCRSCHVAKTHAEKRARMEREWWARQARKHQGGDSQLFRISKYNDCTVSDA